MQGVYKGYISFLGDISGICKGYMRRACGFRGLWFAAYWELGSRVEA